jgi:hypothetical protein
MFAAMKENAAKRKAARKQATINFKNRIAEINEQAELNALSIEAARLANLEKFRDRIAANNAQLKEAWNA